MVYVYKTSVKSNDDINLLKPQLMEQIGKSNWNFDLEDCDKILRLEIDKEKKFEIIKILQEFGFDCEELPD
jgi:hypothetical protein